MFESTLARRIAQKKGDCRVWVSILGTVFVVFLIVNLTASSMAESHAVIQIGSKSSVARYLGQFDGKSNVLMLGATSAIDWICVKIPFKGKLSEVKSIAFSEFVAQTGGQETLEPYIVLKLTEGRTLICNPVTSYSNGTWDLPLMEWQLRDAASKGMWTYATADAKSSTAPLITWIRMMGDMNALSVNLYIGRWNISSPFQCYVGDLAINGIGIDFSNSAKCCGTLGDLPPGF